MRKWPLIPLSLILCITHAWGQSRVVVNPRGPASRPAPVPPPAIIVTIPENVRYTELAIPYARMTAGPNHRLWVTRDQPFVPLSDAETSLRAEFARPEPHILGLLPILFEPGGRVWFLFSGRDDMSVPPRTQVLVGYDGKNLIERAAPGRERFIAAPSPGSPSGFTALFTDDTAFFVAGSTVYGYNDKGWLSRDLLSTESRGANDSVRLFPQADLKGLVAITSTGNVWHCAQGVWTPVNVGRPGYPTGASAPVKGIAALPAGLYLLDESGLSFTSWDSKGPPTVGELMAQLDAPDAQLRQQAESQLLAMGPQLSILINRQLAPDTDPAHRRRLNALILQASRNLNHSLPTTIVGHFQVARPMFLTTLPNGRALLGAAVVTPISASPTIAPASTAPAATRPARASLRPDDPALAGVLEISADGVLRAGGNEYIAALMGSPHAVTNSSGFTPNLTVIPGTSHAWISTVLDDSRLSLLDLTGRRILKSIPSAISGTVTAPVSDDLVIFTATAGPQVAVRPDAPDPATVLKPIFSDSIRGNTEGCLAQTSDGAVWYWSRKGLALFDGARAIPLPQAALLDPITVLIPGKDALIVQSRDKWYLLTRTELLGGELLEDLIVHNRDRVAALFAGPPAHNDNTRSVVIHADSAGNIWLYHRAARELKVLSENTWIDAADALRSAGSRSAAVESFLPAGHSRVFVMTARFPDHNASKVAFFGRINHGSLSMADGPTPAGAVRLDPRGNLWITLQTAPKPIALVRYDDDGPHEHLDGRLASFDNDGELVLVATDPHGHPTERLAFVRDGKPLDLPKIPFLMSEGRFLAAANGRLYLETLIGLRDLRPVGAGPNAAFELGTLFKVGPGNARADICEVTSMLYTVSAAVGEMPKIEFFYPVP